MGGAYKARSGDSVAPIVDSIKSLENRQSRAETPSGTSVSSLVKQVKAAIVGIVAQVNIAVAAALAAGISTSGNVTAGGDLHGVNLYATAAPTYNITGGRVTAWLETATGRLGFASSSRALKTNLEEFALDKSRLILAIGIYYWDYIAEVRKRDDPTYEGYVGPEYHVGRNFGAMAEDFHAAGLWELVVYERTDITELQDTGEVADDGSHVMAEVVVRQELTLNAGGEPHPIAIQDALIGYALIPVVADHDKRIATIEGILGIGSNS